MPPQTDKTAPAINATDRRVRRTRQALHQALLDLILEKRYDKITVQDIIDRADVGRSTFYSHFLDKEDLLLQGMHSFGEHLGEHFGHGVELPDEADENDHAINSLPFFQHAYDNQALYRAMFEGGGGDFVRETARRHITVDIEAHLSARLRSKPTPPVPSLIITHFLAGALMSLLTWWLDEDMPMPPAEIDRMYQTMALPSIEQFIDA